MLIKYFFIILNIVFGTKSYSNILYTITDQKDHNSSELKCLEYEESSYGATQALKNERSLKPLDKTTVNAVESNPLIIFQKIIHQFLFGPKATYEGETANKKKKVYEQNAVQESIPDHYPTGNVLRAELFQNKSGVHLPMSEYLHRGHSRLNITMDFMQTAVNAFAIFLDGNENDILQLPASYVLHSARTISMMKIAREKLAATWAVVKGKQRSDQITHQTLELYRPLFKYLSGKEIAKLNLSDQRILTYIGTHAELDRHQVGVVASRYIKLNKDWCEARYLNLMNNLLCGIPITFMRQIPVSTYLQLSHQIFYHIHACEPLQRRFYLAMMRKTQALGKPYSWNARDVARLGLLLGVVEGNELSAINPEAVAGITAHVMQIMDPQNLQHFTETQREYLSPKPLNILVRKLKLYEERLQIYDSALKTKSVLTLPVISLHFVFR
ncbi:unnamed protein product [Parnassius mnemosyne]|uniref:Uncharacterized protein n=1 Tax=Parnassius mnemosyne TaxID=213953 RepID=A0AAV1M1C6_9NEOP